MRRFLSMIAVVAVLMACMLSCACEAKTFSTSELGQSPVLADVQSQATEGARLGETQPGDGEQTVADKIADKEDGINLRASTAWIVSISAVVILAVAAVVIYLAKKNRKNRS